MHNMALRPQALRQPTHLRPANMPLRQPLGLLEDMPVEPTVALLVRLIALRPMAVLALLLRCMPVIRPSPLALVRRPMPLLLHHMPQTLPSRMNGTQLPARIDAAICASPTPTPCAGTVSKRRVKKNEQRSTLTLSPASLRGFFFADDSARHRAVTFLLFLKSCGARTRPPNLKARRGK